MLCIAFKKRLSIIVTIFVMRQTRETSSLFYWKRLRTYKRRELGKKPSVWSYTSECRTEEYSTKILQKLLKEFTSLLLFWKPEPAKVDSFLVRRGGENVQSFQSVPLSTFKTVHELNMFLCIVLPWNKLLVLFPTCIWWCNSREGQRPFDRKVMLRKVNKLL